jgi:thiol-disulfide isomerase/thioredoxin
MVISSRRWLVVNVLIVLFVVACRGGVSTEPSSSDVLVRTLDGAESSLRDMVSGRTTVVSLWAVWCQPCRRELPALARLADERSDIGLLAIDIGDETSAVRQFLLEIEIDLPVALDADGGVLELLDVPAVPATFIFDEQGEIVWRHLGAVENDDVVEALDALAREGD